MSLFSLSNLRQKSIYLIVLVALIGLANFTSPLKVDVKAQPPRGCPTCSESTLRTIYAPTIGVPEVSGSEIVLNSRSIQVMSVTPTFYTGDGEAIVGAAFEMQPHEMRFVTIESLIPPEHSGHHAWGGISLSYTGKLLEIWGQITLRGESQNGSSDVTFNIVNNLGSDTQEAVW